MYADRRPCLAPMTLSIRISDQRRNDIAGFVNCGLSYQCNGNPQEVTRTRCLHVFTCRWMHLLNTGTTFNRVPLGTALGDGFGGDRYILAPRRFCLWSTANRLTAVNRLDTEILSKLRSVLGLQPVSP